MGLVVNLSFVGNLELAIHLSKWCHPLLVRHVLPERLANRGLSVGALRALMGRSCRPDGVPADLGSATLTELETPPP